MVGEKEEKKTLWYRFTSWVAASWLGRVVKWIADHTGISWALGKMKNLFGGKKGAATPEGETPESPEGNGQVPERNVNGPNPEIPQPVTPEIPKKGGAATPEGKTPESKGNGHENGPNQEIPQPVTPEIPKKGGQANNDNGAPQPKFKQYFSCDKDRLLLVVTNEIYQDLKDNYKNKDNEEEFRTIIQCDGENLCITGSYGSLQDVSGGKKAISVTSVKNEKAGEEHIKTELQAMKTKVGLDDNRRFVEITKISPEPFTPGVSNYEPAVPKSPKGGESIPSPEIPQPVNPEMLKKGGQANGGSPEPSFTNIPANDSQEKFIGSIKVINDVLKLVVPESHVSFIEQNKNPHNQLEYFLYIHKDTLLRITGNNQIYMSDDSEQNVSFSINSVATEDGTSVYSKLEEMRDKLGLNKTTEVKVTIISSKQTTAVESHANDG